MGISYSEFLKNHIKDKLNINKLEVNNLSINVACILDEFSYNCFKYEANFHQLGANDWKAIIDKVKPDLLFVEAAWEGRNKEWMGKIINLSKKNDTSLVSLVHYCKLNNIPTVFWAKEDPYDFHMFIDSAKLFEYIFTTDKNCIKAYQELTGNENVFLLQFAAQPRLHNPIDKDINKKGDLLFAGGWYSKFPSRVNEINYLLEAGSKYNLTIIDRFANSSDIKNSFPNKFKPFIQGSLSYLDMVNEYKKYRVLLNVNADGTSPTTFSRRVYEVLASGIPIISSYSIGIENSFSDIVKLVNNYQETNELIKDLLIDQEYRDRLALLGTRMVLNNHTYSHRFDYILKTIGINNENELEQGVSVITCTNRLYSLDNILNNYQNQLHSKKELIIIVNNNQIPTFIWKEKIRQYDDIRIFRLDKSVSLGECLNYGVSKTKYDIISKFDDDDYYGPNYLVDSVNAFKYTDASIVGKYSVYYNLEGYDSLVLRFPNNENRYIKYVSGSTLTFKKEVYKDVKFKDINRSEDTNFINESISKGYKVYSTDRFNHIINRRKNLSSHTWKISESEILKTSKKIKGVEDYKRFISI
ncbi:MAG: glycosyltransferase [Tissierellaceae bacterium]|nr:glycosyltransferase [Tissierellaceae bacterium]